MYENGSVRVTRGAVQVGAKTYAANYIISVESQVQRARVGRERSLSLLATVCLGWLLYDLLARGTANVLPAGLSLLLFWLAVRHNWGAVTTYRVVMTTAQGEDIQIVADSAEDMKQLHEAISRAIHAWDVYDKSRQQLQ